MDTGNAVIFHGIGTPQRQIDQGEAPYWVSKAMCQDILQLIADLPARERPVITFDDGNLSDYLIGFDLLQRYGLTARFFVLTGRLGQAGSLDAQMLRDMTTAGMVIGSHGIDHVFWPKLSQTALDNELCSSKAAIEDITGLPVTEAGIPFGAYSGRVLRALRSAGYEVAWTSDKGRFKQDEFLRPRTSFEGEMSTAQIEKILQGALSAKARLRRKIGMLRKRL